MELTAIEQRVLGCLIEKERATPQNYPLTLNSLRLACNQSSNRDPVVDYDDASIDHALTSLREQGFTRIVYSTSNRAAKYRHVLEEALHLGDDELAVLAVLMLRGPQTIGEIKGRTERLFAFADLGQVQQTLDRLASRDDGAFVQRLERRPGQKDARYIHLLGPLAEPTSPPHGGYDDDRAVDEREPFSEHGHDDPRPSPVAASGTDDGVVEDLVVEVARLRDEVDELTRRFDEFRAQFD
jgi:uncharacterized protein YceH (UPF0502 family)